MGLLVTLVVVFGVRIDVLEMDEYNGSIINKKGLTATPST